MATPLSMYNLVCGGWRTVLSMVGISIAIILIFMQLGFLGAVTDTAVIFYDKMNFELLVCSPDYYNFTEPGHFSSEHFSRIESVPGVQAVLPLHVSLTKWNYEPTMVQRGILLIGVADASVTFKDRELQEKSRLLQGHRALLVDRTSRPQFLGETNKQPFGDQQIGLPIELNGVACRIAGHFQIGTGLAADGAAIVDQQLFREVVPNYSSRNVGLGLVQLTADADVGKTQRRIQQILSQSYSMQNQPMLDVLNRRQVAQRETRYWLWETPVGFIFFTGAIVAFAVGAIIVYIVLSSDIVKQLGEYATLKAMGYRHSFLSRTVVEQAFFMALTSYVMALAVSLVLYRIVGAAARLPIEMDWLRLVVVLCSSLLMSFLSATIAMRKLRQADPADLF